MNQAEAIEQISKALSRLTFQVAQENFAGFYSKNRLLEDLLLPAFSLILGAPSLRNLNALGPNNAYLDLGDDDARLGRVARAITSTSNLEGAPSKLRLGGSLLPTW